MIGFKDGRFLPVEKLSTTVNSLGVNRGYAAFDYFNVTNGKAFYLDRHMKRFERTAEIMHLRCEYLNNLSSIVEQLLDENSEQNYGVKLFLLPKADDIFPADAELFICPVLLESFQKQEYEQGAKLLLKNYQRFLPEAKTTNYIATQYYQPEILECNAVDVLYHDNGTIRETSRGSFFLIKDGVVLTSENLILPSVTRSVLFDIMNQASIPFQVKDMSIELLEQADEAFVASTNKLVLPIVQVGDVIIGNGKPGKLSKQLFHLFDDHKNSYCKP